MSPIVRQAHVRAVADGDRDTRGCEAARLEANLDATAPDTVATRAPQRRGPREREVSLVRDVTRVREAVLEKRRFEQPLVAAAHHLRRRHRREIRRPLGVPARPERLPEPEQHQRACQDDGEHAEQQQRRLACLARQARSAVRPPCPLSVGRHRPGMSRPPGNHSIHARNKSPTAL